jgi:hypothetical protein
MKIVRYSAIENFGVPIDSPEHVGSTQRLMDLMRAYSIEGKEIPTELTDITPYYWRNPTFRYYLSRRSINGPAVIDLMPRYNDSATTTFESIAPGINISGFTEKRTYEIPTYKGAMAIIGPGPRFIGQLCVHELIVPALIAA